MNTTCPICKQQLDIPSQAPRLCQTYCGLVVIYKFFFYHMFNGHWCASNGTQFAAPANVGRGATKLDPKYRKKRPFGGRWRGPFSIGDVS